MTDILNDFYEAKRDAFTLAMDIMNNNTGIDSKDKVNELFNLSDRIYEHIYEGAPAKLSSLIKETKIEE